MKWKKKYFINTIWIILIIVGILFVVTNVMNKQYDNVIKYVSAMLGSSLYLLIELLCLRKLRTKKSNFELNGLCLIAIYSIPLVVTFVSSIISDDFFVENICGGLIIPCALFLGSRLNGWIDENESSQNPEKKAE